MISRGCGSAPQGWPVAFFMLGVAMCGSGALASFARSADSALICNSGSIQDKPRNLTYTTNAWNPVPGGFQCLTTNTDDSDVWFNAPWFWASDDEEHVHSYPHVKFGCADLPIALKNISSMRLTGSWIMRSGSLEARPRFSGWDDSKSELEDLGVKANVAFDMFLDPDPTKSSNSVQAGIELMIWLGSIGDPWPLKHQTLGTQKLGDQEFTLYFGKNQRDHKVFTWVLTSGEDMTSFDSDVSPLLEYVWRNGLIPNSTYVGMVEFGSETWISSANVTFSASDYGLSLNASGARTSGTSIDPLPSGCCDLESGAARTRTRLAPAGATVFLVHVVVAFLSLSLM